MITVILRYLSNDLIFNPNILTNIKLIGLYWVSQDLMIIVYI